ncbi:hypothetical protein NBRC10513v2_002214 [Rhodotorula toruloides]|uniref:BY PROTMAP: gi/472588504/gb/EMS25976.1/ CCR4-NOT transcriptional complex subunit CAF120 [Rhodosporidium toruloides NP11] gi/647396296/emb/CDR38336.1/ RHTO0S03e08394g1_1 [Rhodosporidium toruloides] n=1 Tax=Rhodotorula toruloides TaxID=5286 RepID=A0A0K3C835_RHOTO
MSGQQQGQHGGYGQQQQYQYQQGDYAGSQGPAYGRPPQPNQGFERAMPHPHRQSSYGLPPPINTQDPRVRNGSQQGSSGSASPIGPPPGRPYPSSGPPSASRQSPVPTVSTQSHQVREGSSITPQTTRPTSQLPSHGSSRSLASQAAPQTIAGEPLHDLDRAVALLKSSKFYAEGFLMKKVEAGPDGKAPTGADGQWAKWFVQLSGTIMSTWNAADMEDAACNNRTVPPQYLNLQDAFVHPFPPHGRGSKSPTQFQFALNSAGANRILFCAPSLQSLTMWINAIRLSTWERSRCNEIWTGSLLGLREPKPLGWQGFDAGLPAAGGGKATPGRFEGWLKVRLPGDTEWRRVWAVLFRGSSVPTRSSIVGGPAAVQAEEKKSRRSSLLSFGGKKDKREEVVIEDLPGEGAISTFAFFDRKPGKKELPICIVQHVFYIAAIFPESEALMEGSTLFKVEGTFLNPSDSYLASGWGVGGRAEKQGFALLMLEEGNYLDMLHWVVGLADAFKLYGRPRNFSFDPRDPNSFYFALPIGPHRDRQFLDRELVDNLNINENRPRAVRATFHNILFDRMRGVRPAALANEPPPQAGRESPATVDAPQQMPDETEDASRRFSQPPMAQPRNDSPQLPPILPTIGEGSLVDDAQGSVRPADFAQSTEPSRSEHYEQQPEAAHRERQNVADRHTSQYGVIEGYLDQQRQPQQADTAPMAAPQAQPRASVGERPAEYASGPRRPSRDASTAENELGTYEAFLSSDVARETTPPPPQHVPPRFEPSQRSSYVDQSRLAPIITAPSLYTSSNGSARSTPLQSTTAATENAPGRLGVSPPSQRHADQLETLDSYQQSPMQSATSPVGRPLPSPGAPSLVSTAGPGTPASPGLPYLAGSPQAAQAHFAPPVAAAAPAIPHVDVREQPRAAPAEGPAAHDAPPTFSARQPTSEHATDAGPVQTHDGKVVDSPENLQLESPTEGAFTTQPLFASSSRSAQSDHAHAPVAPVAQEPVAPRPQTPPPVEAPTASAAAPAHASPNKRAYDMPEDANIHSDLLAALNFVDRSESPEPATPHTMSSVEPSPITASRAFHVGPPKHDMFRPPTPSDENYGSDAKDGPVEVLANGAARPTTQPAPASAEPPQTSSFPSSFAQNKRAQERAAAAQLAQQAQHAALTKPGRPAGMAGQQRKKMWEDSDEEEEEENEDEESEDVHSAQQQPPRPVTQSASNSSIAPSPARSRVASPLPPPVAMEVPQDHLRQGRSPQRSPGIDPAARQSYLDNGPGRQHPYPHTAPPASPTRDFDTEAGQQMSRKPALNPHGLLATGMLEKEERSARAQEHAARDTGGTLVSLPAKAPPPQTGLVGALTSHEREKERTGGVGRALTEQQKERKLAEQRQKQLDELQKQQLAMMQQQMQMAQFGGGFGNPMSMGFGGSNPWMMGGMGGMMPGMGGFGGFPGMPGAGSQVGGVSPPLQPQNTGGGADFQQAAFQQQQAMMAAQAAAQQAAQQAYLAAMSQFSQPMASPGGASPTLPPSSFPSMPSMNFMPTPYGFSPASPTMATSPSFMAPQFGGFMPGHGQQPSMSMYGGAGGLGGGQGGDGDNNAARAVSPLDLGRQQHARKEGSE